MPMPRRKRALDDAAVATLLATVPEWRSPDRKRIEREFRFPDFKSALAFANRVGALAEEADHHPNLLVAWGKVGVVLTTHSAKGLTENDFDLAAGIDRI